MTPRRAVVLAGRRAWCEAQAPDAPRISGDGARLLGQEFDTLVFDAFDGFDPDAFGAVVGTIRAGGTLFLLTPPLAEWPTFADPERARIAAWPYRPEEVGGRFLARLVATLEAADGVVIRTENDPPTSLSAQQPPHPYEVPPAGWVGCGGGSPGADAGANAGARGEGENAGARGEGEGEGTTRCATGEGEGEGEGTTGCATGDQAAAVEALVKVGRGRRRRPVVLTSDRGRGKSAALGLAAARLLAERPRSIVVTGPSRRAVEPVFRHAGEVPEGSRLRFVPPGELLPNLGDADVVWVDEAATLPVPLLERLLRGHPRIAFATTIHGYEGTGRGFAVRFRDVLDTVTPDWRPVRLEAPIRYPANDPLERLGFRALLLDATPAPDAAVAAAASDGCTIERVDRDALATDERGLSQLFGLLVLAHYKTRPSDLRRLLDAPNLAVYAMRHGEHVVGTALVAREGGFDAEMCDAIYSGRRRPHAHMLPETLSAHLGLLGAPALSGARVIRIAVHPAVRTRGLGSALLEAVVEGARADGLDYVGSGFGATETLLRFWIRAAMQPVRIGVTRGATSGVRSAVVLRGLTPAGEALTDAARARFTRHLPHMLSDALADLEPALVCALLHASTLAPPALDDDDWADVSACAAGHRVFDVCVGPVFDLVLGALAQDPATPGREVLVTKVLQKRSWTEVAESLDLPGRAGVNSALRSALQGLVERWRATHSAAGGHSSR